MVLIREGQYHHVRHQAFALFMEEYNHAFSQIRQRFDCKTEIINSKVCSKKKAVFTISVKCCIFKKERHDRFTFICCQSFVNKIKTAKNGNVFIHIGHFNKKQDCNPI
jgi:hypothetical protein